MDGAINNTSVASHTSTNPREIIVSYWFFMENILKIVWRFQAQVFLHIVISEGSSRTTRVWAAAIKIQLFCLVLRAGSNLKLVSDLSDSDGSETQLKIWMVLSITGVSQVTLPQI